MMSASKRIRPGTVIIGLVIFIIAAGYALEIVGGIIVAQAGGESMVITSGYTIGDPTYELRDSDPSIIDQVVFTLTGTPEAAFAKVKLDADGVWYCCVLTEGGSHIIAMCDTISPQLTVKETDQFQVVASSVYPEG